MQLLIRLTVLVLALSTSAACSQLNAMANLAPPDVKLAGLKLSQSNLFEQKFLVELDVQNPNSQAMPINGLYFDIFLNGSKLGSAQSIAPANIPGNSNKTLALSLSTSTFAWLQLAKSLQNAQHDIDYQLKGNLVSEGLFPRLPITRSGQLNLGALLSGR